MNFLKKLLGLSPKDEANARAQEIVSELTDSDAPHLVRHWAYFSSADDQERFARLVPQNGFDIAYEHNEAPGERPFCVCVTKIQVPDADIEESYELLEKIAAECNGEYDGWEVEIPPSEAVN